ncbi:hypothetical protein ACQKPE_18085 [Pseudomonas sp. NPDC089554]|uniref:hypothetical protein n=1 Tax=Pseudomonas sp. NPDC089554 TaxID=3390653 RepID=UPI003D0151C1
MQSLEYLIEALPVDDGQTDTSALEQATLRLLCGLEASSEPITWLNQAGTALAAQAQADATWAQALPAELREHQATIAEHPDAWRVALEQAMQYQADAYADLLALGSLPARYPRLLNDRHQQVHLQRLLARFGQGAPSATALAPWRALLASRRVAWKRLQDELNGDQAGLFVSPETLRNATSDAMRAEMGLQVEEGQLPASLHQHLLAPEDQGLVTWLAVQLGEQTLPGVWVLAESTAWTAGRQDAPLLLWVHGEGGGMACLNDRRALLERLDLTLREGGLPLATALPDSAAQVQLVPADNGLDSLLQALLAYWQGTLGEPDDESDEHERALDLARAALAIAADTCRQAALAQAERQWQVDSLIEHMPAWVLSRSDDERKAYGKQLAEYHIAALALESTLQTEAPLFHQWAGNLLKARLHDDLGIDVDIDDILLWRPDPSMDQTLPYLPSTVTEIACESFDPDSADEYTRLDLTRWQVEGIDAHYLARVLPELDPLKRYQEKLHKVFDPDQADDPERLRAPYRLELQMLATSEHWRGALSAEGARMLQQASTAQSRQDLDALGLRLHWLVVQAHEELGHNIEGVAALENESGHALLYLPVAITAVRLIERDSLAGAVEHLASEIRSTPQVARYVAQRCGNDPARLLAYLRQAAMRNYTGYLTSAPSLDQTLVGLQLAERRNVLLAQARESGRSQASTHKDNAYSAHLRHTGYLRAALGVVPGLGSWYAVMDIHDGALELAESWRTGSSLQMLRGTLSVVMGIIEIFSTVLPVGASVSALRRVVRQAARLRVARQPFRGYASGQSLNGAEPLGGLDANTWRTQGKQYLWQDGVAYEVYRRSDEATLRLRATATRRYEAPVRQDGGRWVMHGDVGLRGGGGKLTEAERLFADWGPRSRHWPLSQMSRTQALARGRLELARYRFPNEHQQVEFTYSFLQDGVAPRWARQYLRDGAITDIIVPGDTWQAVRWNVAQGDRIVDLHGGRVNIFFAGPDVATAQPGLRLEGHYYPTLAGEAFGGTAYVRPSGRMPRNLAELDSLIEQGSGPVRVALGATAVDAPVVVGGFTQTFRQRLATRLPLLSENSRRALGEALYRNADRTTTELSHARLAHLGERIGDTNLEPLREMTAIPVQGQARHIYLSTQDDALRQLGWPLQPVEHRALRRALENVESAALGTVLRDVLTARGYQVIDSLGTAERHLVLFRRSGQTEIYMLLQGRTLGPISLQGPNGLVALSDAWMDFMIASIHSLRLAAVLRTARRSGVLRTVLGGVHLDGPDRSLLVWERVTVVATSQAQLPRLRNWRHDLRPLTAGDHELVPSSGLYGAEGQVSVSGVGVNGRLLPVFPVDSGSRMVLSRSSNLSDTLSFDELELCLRERFGEQPWMVVGGASGWTVRRPLFNAPLDRHVARARAGLTRQSALNAARYVFEHAEGSMHERLIRLEHITGSWAYGSRPVDELADPLLLLAQQTPTELDEALAWSLALPIDVASATPAVYYLRAVDDYTQGLLAAVSGTRMRAHALNVVDDMLVRYGLNQEHRTGAVALYHQASSNRSYLLAMAVSEQPSVEFAFQEGRAVLSNDWLQHWRQQLPAEAAQRLQEAEEGGRLVRMVAILRLEEGPHIGQVALQRLADF